MPYKSKEYAKRRRAELYQLDKVNRRIKERQQTPVYRLRLKAKILTHYGNGKLACVNCGFSDIQALSIDHINGNGAEWRKLHGGRSSIILYRYLQRENFPEGYQTLCMNCQFIKRVLCRGKSL